MPTAILIIAVVWAASLAIVVVVAVSIDAGVSCLAEAPGRLSEDGGGRTMAEDGCNTAGRGTSGSRWIDRLWKLHVEAAIEAGLYVPPEGVTVDDLVAAMEWAPIGPAPPRRKVRDQDLPAVGSFG